MVSLLSTSAPLLPVPVYSCLNTTAIEASGINPLRPFVKQVEEIKDLVSLEAVIFWMHKVTRIGRRIKNRIFYAFVLWMRKDALFDACFDQRSSCGRYLGDTQGETQ